MIGERMEVIQKCIKNPEYREEIKGRIAVRMAGVEDVFVEIQTRGLIPNATLNKALLYTAIDSYYKDIERIKCFHPIPFTDKHKKAAFSIKWLIKLKPIQLENMCDDDNISKKEILINEYFAIFIAMALLDLDFTLYEMPSSKYIANLLYTLYYREVNGMVLSSVMYLLECGLKKNIP